MAPTSQTQSCVFQCLARFEEAASSDRKNEAEIEKEWLCVWIVPCRNIMDFPPSLQCSAMISLAQLCGVELGNHHSGRNCRKENSLTTSFSPQSRRNRTEWKTRRAHLATGETQTCILGFEAECSYPLCPFPRPLFCPQVQAARDELLGWFPWIWKPFPGPDANTALQGAQHNTRSLCQTMMKGKLQR